MTMPYPRIVDLWSQKTHLRSVEFFPPKEENGLDALKEIASSLQPFKSDFVSVTYGAGGSTRERSLKMSEMLRDRFNYNVMPHLTCVGNSRRELEAIVKDLTQRGFCNFMALRGDPPKGEKTFQPPADGLHHGGDLVALIRSISEKLCIGVGGYPEKHPEAASLVEDIGHLKWKVDQGAHFVTTQLFFRNEVYFHFVQQCRQAGITVPILPGIMPVISLKQVQRFTQLCGSTLPAELIGRLQAVEDNAEAMEQVGIDWALQQIQGLLAGGAPGFHLYILNRSRAALAMAHALQNVAV